MHCSANVRKSRRRRPSVRPVGHGENDPVRGSRAAAHRRRRARLERRRRLRFEGGCYAKVIQLNADHEPEIFATTRTFGTVLENVAMDAAGNLDLDSDAKTENTRAAYPIRQLANIVASGCAGHARNILFLSADAFGVLPPVAKLTTASHVLLPVRVHGQGRGDRARGQGAAGDVFRLFRGAVPSAAPHRLRADARREDLEASPGCLVDQHRLDRRTYGVGHRMAIPHTRDDSSALSGSIAERLFPWTASSGLCADAGAGCARRRSRSASDLVRSQGVRRAGLEARRNVPREFQRTSTRSAMTSRPRPREASGMRPALFVPLAMLRPPAPAGNSTGPASDRVTLRAATWS